MFTWEHTALSDEETWAMLTKLINDACESLNGMKAREGQALADLVDRRRGY